MTITQKTHELGKLIEESKEMAQYKATEEAQKNDAEAVILMREFNDNRIKLAKSMQSGEMTQE